ncbi:hypothetical protein [Streptomyces sp. Tu 3180]|uniref:hypothetical protein n=1 Tax=Streptomyces sp. Tu 3180 TaxID=2682611 RepID=UPI00135C6A29|nr:hypothetical protein [Streptomyces sp. Tu 3180]KAF3463519.1 hypothetical protein GL259_03760 [Streptomyces sp. Tu 3180]
MVVPLAVGEARQWGKQDVDMESAPVVSRTALDVFARDLALCLSVHRDRGPALVWPDGLEALAAEPSLADFAQVIAGTATATTPPMPPGCPGGVAEELGRLLGCEVRRSLVLLLAGEERPDNRAATDLVLLPVQGGCDCRVELEPRGADPAASPRDLNLRLRVGEALYVPGGLTYALGGVHAPCLLQVISLHAASW